MKSLEIKNTVSFSASGWKSQRPQRGNWIINQLVISRLRQYLRTLPCDNDDDDGDDDECGDDVDNQPTCHYLPQIVSANSSL